MPETQHLKPRQKGMCTLLCGSGLEELLSGPAARIRKADSPPDVSTLGHMAKENPLLSRREQSFIECQHCAGHGEQSRESNRYYPHPHETCSPVREMVNKQTAHG